MPHFFKLTVKLSNFQHKNTFLKSNRQYLKNQQTALSAPDSPCQTDYPKSMPDSFEFFRLFIHPWIDIGRGT